MRTETEVAPRMVSALPVPRVDVPAAWEAAQRLRHVARVAASSLSVVEQAHVDAWSGSASTAYYDLRGRAAGRLDVTAGFARESATAIERYAEAVAPAVAAMRRAATDLDIALSQRTTASDAATFLTTRVAIDDAHIRYEKAQVEYDAAVADLRARLAAVPTFPDEPRTLAQHTADGIRRLWRDAVTDPTAGAQMLALGWVDDPAGWRSMVSDIPAGLWDQATHPRRTVDQLLAGDDVRNGQIGAAVGTWLSMAAMPAKALKMASPEIRTRYARNMADPNAPRPRVQTIDEMLATVDLAAHEHHALGHAIRRHVDVDDDYLRDRLDNGTLLDDGSRSKKPPPHASSWNDLETAELATTYVLRNYEADLRKFAAGEIDRLPELTGNFPESLGRVMSPAPNGVVVREAGKVIVTVGKKDGHLYIVSSYLEP